MWESVASKNAKRKIMKAFKRGDMRELARRSAVFRETDPTWLLPDDLRQLVSIRHDQYRWAPPPLDRKAPPPMVRMAPPPMDRKEQRLAPPLGGNDEDVPPRYYEGLWHDGTPFTECTVDDAPPPGYYVYDL